ncbi:hypothetical protein IWZ03DRAFT_376801, partial [Phyllosticta citriasiana]
MPAIFILMALRPTVGDVCTICSFQGPCRPTSIPGAKGVDGLGRLAAVHVPSLHSRQPLSCLAKQLASGGECQRAVPSYEEPRRQRPRNAARKRASWLANGAISCCSLDSASPPCARRRHSWLSSTSVPSSQTPGPRGDRRVSEQRAADVGRSWRCRLPGGLFT